ncbi:MAG: SDH family Clp fold serine proteinase [Bacillota bacterium]
MARQHRIELIREIGRRRDSAVICYITGDRENLSTRIAPDVVPVFYRQLEMLPDRRRIDLFLYTRGGDVITPWRLVHLIREYTPEFCVLVPFRSYSAGTLLCLGADEIVMGVMGELGPIDPSVINAYNPQDPYNPSARIPVNIEDVYSYLALAGETASLDVDAMSRVFSILAEKIHPLALGNVHRNYLLIRSLANKLLGLRKCRLCTENEGKIVDNLTEKLYAHNYTITRREAAEDIGLPVSYPDKELERIIWALYDDFAREFNLAEPFDPRDIISTGHRREFDVPAGVVESQYGCDYFIYSGVVEKRLHNGESQIDVDIIKQGWRTVE